MALSASSAHRSLVAFTAEKGIPESTMTMRCTSKSPFGELLYWAALLIGLYSLTVQHALETTSIGDVPMKRIRNAPAASQNPYILPFAMRGLMEEDYVRTELYDEMAELLKQFDEWKPSSKVLRDTKFRLEGIRSKL